MCFESEWMRRMEKLGYNMDEPIRESYNKLSNKDLIVIADEETKNRRESIYIVRDTTAPELSFPIAFTNNRFVVYKMRP